MPEQEHQFQRRQTAYKVSIKDILNSRYIKNEGFTPNYIEVNTREISRVNIIGFVVQKSELSNYKILAIDDGTGKISARVFENSALLSEVNISDVVIIIGRPREFSSEKYILIEIIKKIDPVWAKVRKLELRKNNDANNIPKNKNNLGKENNPDNDVVDLGPTNKVLKLIKELDKGNGVSIDDLSLNGVTDLDKIIEMLLKEGDIFEIKPGKLKVLE